MTQNDTTCPHCGGQLETVGGLPFCTHCNDTRGAFYNPLTSSINEFALCSDKVLIECPGATLYGPGTNDVIAGVKFFDNNDPRQGYEIIDRPVYGPKHVKRRWVKRDDAHLIRRCQSCQDHTVRMRRKEGPDLYIPSRKNPQPHRQNRQNQKNDLYDRPGR